MYGPTPLTSSRGIFSTLTQATIRAPPLLRRCTECTQLFTVHTRIPCQNMRSIHENVTQKQRHNCFSDIHPHYIFSVSSPFLTQLPPHHGPAWEKRANLLMGCLLADTVSYSCSVFILFRISVENIYPRNFRCYVVNLPVWTSVSPLVMGKNNKIRGKTAFLEALCHFTP